MAPTPGPAVPVRSLTATEQRQWSDAGYLLLRDVVSRAAIQQMRALYAHVAETFLEQLRAEGLITELHPDLPFERRFAVAAGKHAAKFGRGWRRAVAQRAVFDLHHDPALLDVVAELLGGDVIGHPIFNARPKLPGQQLTVVPWHQDSSYFGPASEQILILTCWIPLVPVDAKNGCLQVIPGSHRERLHPHLQEDREGQFLELPASVVDESRAVTVPMAPGDALLFTNLTIHRSLPSVADTIRWSIDIRFLRDGARPDQAAAQWPDADFEWVVRSRTRPATTFESWHQQTSRFTW